MQPSTRKRSLSLTLKGFNFCIKTLILLLFFVFPHAVRAQFPDQWWYQQRCDNKQSAHSYFNAQFDVSGGFLKVETFTYNGEYHCDFRGGWSFWVATATLAFSTDGTNYVDFYTWTEDHGNWISGGSLNGQSVGNAGAYRSTPDGSRLRSFSLYTSTPVTNIKKIKLTALTKEDWWGTVGAPQTVTEILDVSVPQLTSIATPTFDFLPVQNNTGGYEPKVRLGYQKPSALTEVDKVSNMVINESSPPQDKRVTGYLPVASSGSFDLPTSSTAKKYYYQQLAYNEKWYSSSNAATVPAFTFPKTASAVYDPVSQQVTFSWTMDPVTDQNVVTDKFKLQVADNPDFTDARDVSVDYDQSKSTFNYVVSSALSPQMYFRVARAHTGFNWEVAKTASVPVSFVSIPSTATASLSGKTAVINWDPVASAWLPGSKFVITRINNTAKTSSEISLNKQDFDAGTYTDKQIATCNSYNYTLQVVPPVGSSFTAFAPVQIPQEILPTEIGSLSNLEVSKGYFPDRTELRWSTSGVFDNFIIKRAVYGTSNFVQVATVPGSLNSEYQTDDPKGTPGVYYTYQVQGVVKCNNTSVFSTETLTGIGFRSPTGNIYGRITYENGQAVEDVAVRLQSNDQVQLGKSMYFNGTPDSHLEMPGTSTYAFNNEATVEAWIKPDAVNPANQTILFSSHLFELGFTSDSKLYFYYKGLLVQGAYSNPTGSFVHVTGIHTKDSLFLMLNNDVIGRTAAPLGSSSFTPLKTYIGSDDHSGRLFKGYLDEMRIFNTAISIEQAVKSQGRILAGDEAGLVAYWRFDETIADQFYDLSFHGDAYNRNDGTMSSTAVTRSTTTPTADQLSLKSFTDLSGNYFISGIPYIGNGTTYTIVPLKGTHQFDPISVNRLISPSSTQFTVDFKDKSSFPVSGYVYYQNTTVPVPDVQFKIDGLYAQQSNGDLIQTDENGAFTISVPVGVHEVKAVKANHVFANGGKITDLFRANLNYQGNLAGINLSDSTTIRFIGRVAGGAVQSDMPLGHSVSVNNLGKDLAVTLTLPTGNKYILDSTNKTTVVKHLLPANIQDSAKIHKTQVVYNEHSIVIKPDPVTGEFAADLIPVKFLASSVTATGWENILLDDKPVVLDFTDKFGTQGSTRRWTDSTINNQGTYDKKEYFDSLTFNASYKFIKRVDPSVVVYQKGDDGKALPYFGNLTYKSVSITGQEETILVTDTTKTGKAIYLYGSPVFSQGQAYKFGVKAFEQYKYYQGPATVTRVDNVPTSDGFVSVYNNLRNGSTAAPDTVSLDEKGEAKYEFEVGDPGLATGGLKDFATSIRFGEATNKSWTFFGAPQMRSFVMGGKLAGTDFVTAGPDNILMVLRDPPGSKSFSFAEKGSTIKTATTYTGTFTNEGDVEATSKLGTHLVTFQGLGAGVINEVTALGGETIGVHHEEGFTGSDTKETTTTLTTKFKTSDDPLFVGPVADVFVGYSSNITYGESNNVTIIRRRDKKATDVLLYEPSADTTYIVVKRGGINIGETFGTLFAYPQQHIEKVLIPNLLNIRNTVLLPAGTSLANAQSLANSKQTAVYISKWPAADTAHFAKSNNDTRVFGASAMNAVFGDGPGYKILFPANSTYRTDTIMILNQYVAAWEKRMADNEKAKLESTLIQNYSFHAASPIEYSTTTSVNNTHTEEYKFIVSGSYTTSNEVNVNELGFELKIVAKTGGEYAHGSETSTENQSTLGFTLASEGTDDYFSLDLNKAADNSFVFHTKGGASGCPYVGAVVTKYYRPGTVIDQPTARIEVPVLLVDNPVANDVPTSRKAVYNLTLRNESEAKLPATFVIGYTDNDSIQGATLAVDGTPIGGAGRAVYLQYGESITKVLTLTRGPNAMDYNNIQVLLHSNCQYDPTGYRENIADTVLLSAHFIPSCSDIDIKSPKDKWVLNSESPVNTQGKRYLPIVIDKFDVTNTLFDHIELQYKPTSSSTWITVTKFYADSAHYKAAQGEKQLITDASGINYNFVLDDGSFNDQAYDIQAVSYCKVGNNYVTTESNLINGIKDTYNPRLFGSPQPANGILTANDDVRLNFNETIAAGLLTASDFQVTGIRNGAKSDHSVSVRLDGVSNYLATEFEKSFTGKNITAEMWVLPTAAANQTVFSHGDVNESLELSLTSDNKMQITVGARVIKSASSYAYKPGEWAHVALVYNDDSKTVSAFYNFVEMIHAVPVNAYTGTGHIEWGRSISKGNSYFKGTIHEARIWNDTLNSVKLQINSLSVLSGAENALLGYYPMNEGKGVVVFDKAHGSNAQLNGLWNILPVGKSVSLNGNGYVKTNTSFAPVLSSMDYTIELWFKGDATQGNATLASNGKGDGTDAGGSLNLFNLGFENGLLTFSNNGFKVQADGAYLDNKWHHVAISVNRNSGIAQLFVDGLLNQFFDAKNLGGIAAAATYLGVRSYFTPAAPITAKFDRYFKGSIDEFRIWNTYLNQTLIAANNNVKLQGSELGLMAYYPFETYIMFQGVNQSYYSLKDTKVQEVVTTVVPDATVLNATASNDGAPIKDRGPVDNLKFDFVVNNDALIINLQEPKQAIDKTVITFKSKNVRDLNGNKILSPVTWTAYIDQNQLKWSDDQINLVKDVGTPLTFESHLVNNGGSAQHYTIYNLPSWLSADPSTGSVDPKGNLKISFTVNEGLNIGSYEEIIFMRNDNNETEALKITLQVKGKKPDWVVKPSDFDYNMVVYGKLRLNNIFSINKEDMLGAFINGKCVGVANNTFNASNNLWYTFLTVYSTAPTVSNVEFRIWQASTGKIFRATPSIPISFANDAIVGTSSAPVIFDGSATFYKDMAINENWNWVSFNLQIPAATNINATLVNGAWTSNDLIKNEASGTGPNRGFSNYTTNGGWRGTLTQLDNLSLYKLKAANAQSLTVSGTVVDVKTTAIPLRGARWNYISYLPQVNATLKEGLAGYKAFDGDVIKSQTGFAMYSPQSGWIGSLAYLEPGKGYMLYRKRTNDTAFYYPAINGSLGGRLQDGGIDKPKTAESPVPANFSNADNMTVAAVVTPDFDYKKGDVILAFVNGELRGKAAALYNPETGGNAFFCTIGGDAEQPVVFMVERNGQIVAQSTTILAYRSNTHIGTLAKPAALHFVQGTGGVAVYPNPFNNNTTIAVDLRGLGSLRDHSIQVSVTDIAGRQVLKMPVKTVSGTGFTATWNGRTAAGGTVAGGVYFISVTVDGVQHVSKVVKQ